MFCTTAPLPNCVHACPSTWVTTAGYAINMCIDCLLGVDWKFLDAKPKTGNMGAEPSKAWVFEKGSGLDGVTVSEAVVEDLTGDPTARLPEPLREKLEQAEERVQQKQRMIFEEGFKFGVQKAAQQLQNAKAAMKEEWVLEQNEQTKARIAEVEAATGAGSAPEPTRRTTCSQKRGELFKCLEQNQGTPLNCLDLVDQFTACAERARAEHLSKTYLDAV
eukprot:m.44144 g.44144  ORF g.44144 m.44144 type:complete len:219 (-) comp10821_c0_seq4:180-836(-)